jgi:hypothetical protein
MEDVTNAYLTWKYPASPPGEQPSNSHSNSNPSIISNNYDFDIAVIDIFTLQSTRRIPRTAMERTAPALVRCGYIGNTPEQPSLAISIKTVELFRKLRLRKPSFSVKAFAKVICDYYMVCLEA